MIHRPSMALLNKFLRRFPHVNFLISEMDRLSSALSSEQAKTASLSEELALISDRLENPMNADGSFVPPGHFYSPLPSLQEIKERECEIFDKIPREINAVDLNELDQVRLIEIFSGYYRELPYHPDKSLYDAMSKLVSEYTIDSTSKERKREILSSYNRMLQNKDRGKLRFFFENMSFGFADGIALFCMLRHVKPNRIIEIGSGFSSCLILDINELFFNNSIDCTFIDPYPEKLLSLIWGQDKKNISIMQSRLQDLNMSMFSSLNRGDVLFIDSTHVSKVGSDVNKIIFDILPALNSGVFVHFHDIFYPFEYPREWIFEGRAWNESYILRAFLQYNRSFKIVFFSSFMRQFHEDLLNKNIPLFTNDKGGSLWLEKQ